MRCTTAKGRTTVGLRTIESGGHCFRDLNLEEAVEVTADFLDGVGGGSESWVECQDEAATPLCSEIG